MPDYFLFDPLSKLTMILIVEIINILMTELSKEDSDHQSVSLRQRVAGIGKC